MLREEIEIIASELRRLREDGVEGVYIDDATLTALRAQAPTLPAEEALAASTAREPAQTHRRAASSPDLTALIAEGSTPPSPKKKVARKAGVSAPAANIPDTPPEFDLPEGDKQSRIDWLRERVLNDEVCKANVKPERHIVFGVGSPDADIFFCGEAPGEDEEKQGEPFVGPAGQKLNGMIKAMGIEREQVYIANIMNWRPDTGRAYGNRAPTQAEMAYCLPYLAAQVAIVQPKVIVALGRTAVDGLLGPDPDRRMGDIIGQWHEFAGIPVIPAYHPSYILRNDTNKAKRAQWECLLAVMEKIGMPISDRQRGYFT